VTHRATHVTFVGMEAVLLRQIVTFGLAAAQVKTCDLSLVRTHVSNFTILVMTSKYTRQ